MAIRVKGAKHTYTTHMTPLMGREGTKLGTFPERGVGMFSHPKRRGDDKAKQMCVYLIYCCNFKKGAKAKCFNDFVGTEVSQEGGSVVWPSQD